MAVAPGHTHHPHPAAGAPRGTGAPPRPGTGRPGGLPRITRLAQLGVLVGLAAATLAVAVAPQRATASPPGPAAAPSDDRVVERVVTTTGCGQPTPYPAGETTPAELEVDGEPRAFLVHVPADYQPERPLPLVLSYHARNRDAAYQEELTGMSELDAVVAYPQSLVGTEDKTAWQGAPYSPDVDDVLFTSELITLLQEQLCVDERRVYAAGKSNGGGFVGLLACRLPERIAAFAPVAGAFYPDVVECAPERPASILNIHGLADPTVPYEGNPDKGQQAISAWLAEWAERDGCVSGPYSRDLGDGVTHQRWLGCAEGTEVAHLRVADLGHHWPSTEPNADTATPSALDATPALWAFFLDHPLPRGGAA